MTAYDTYGTNSCTAKELAGLLADRLGVAFAERESHYLGVYFLAALADTTRLQVQPNAIPGDDGKTISTTRSTPTCRYSCSSPHRPLGLSTTSSRRSENSPGSDQLEAEQLPIHKS